jgi:hypothetical protein
MGQKTRRKPMRKFLLMALAGAAMVLAVPEVTSATPLSLGGGLDAAADNVSNTEVVHYRHHHHRYHHHRYHHRHRHCWHRRHHSGRRCSW